MEIPKFECPNCTRKMESKPTGNIGVQFDDFVATCINCKAKIEFRILNGKSILIQKFPKPITYK